MRIAALAIMVGGSAFTSDGLSGCSEQPDEIRVTWSIPEGPGASGVELVGCHDWGRDLELHQAVLEPGWQRCSVRAWRKDGLLRVHSSTVRIDGDETSVHIDFDLPEGPIGGMGAEVRAFGPGVRIERVIEGSPAARAGIDAGERVVEVNGVSTDGMSTASFVRKVTGVPGTGVYLTIASPGCHESSVRQVWIKRERIRD